MRLDADAATAAYFPPPGASGRWADDDAGDPVRLDDAVRFAIDHECDWPRSLLLPDGRFVGTAYVEDRPPYDSTLGLVRPRNAANGVVLRRGRVVARWGDVERADTTFSAAKSYLSLVAGLAVDDGLIRSIDETVASRRLDDGFDAPQNRSITWRHLLQQASEWHGTLWDRPDSVDHQRQVTGAHDNAAKGVPRTLEPPGTRWEYNDVRVNRLALSLTRLFGRSLEDVLRERVMDPIGASRDWQWHGYANSTIEIDGRPVTSVVGGSHWGGGLFVPTLDHARVALLVQGRGAWGDRRLVSERWIDFMRTPTPANKLYGALWWLNTDRELYPSAPAGSLFAVGGGTNLVCIDDEHELVIVARWVARDRCDELLRRVFVHFV